MPASRNRRVDGASNFEPHTELQPRSQRRRSPSARSGAAATGTTRVPPQADARDVVTPNQAQIARLQAIGASSPEISAQLFISPHPVEYHVRKVFEKLDITFRKELDHALTGP